MRATSRPPDCSERSWDCHGKCERYAAFRAQKDAEMVERQKHKEDNSRSVAYEARVKRFLSRRK